MNLDEKTQIIDGITYRYSTDWIHSLEGEEHWMIYWHQIGFILDDLTNGDSILEIGPGNGFITNYLRSKGYRVTTLDIDEGKNPDIVANVVLHEFNETFDHIIAFEVFEHIPFEKFVSVLPKLKKTCNKNLFFSVPGNYKIWFKLNGIIPYYKKFSFTLKFRRNKIKADHHFWEYNYKEYTLKKLEKVFTEAGFRLVRTKKLDLNLFVHLSSAG